MTSPPRNSQAAIQRTINFTFPTLLVILSSWSTWASTNEKNINGWNFAPFVKSSIGDFWINLGPAWILMIFALMITLIVGLDAFKIWKSPAWLPHTFAIYGLFYTVLSWQRAIECNQIIGSGLILSGLGFLSFLILMKNKNFLALIIYMLCGLEILFLCSGLISTLTSYTPDNMHPSIFMAGMIFMGAYLLSTIAVLIVIAIHEIKLFKLKIKPRLFNRLVFCSLATSVALSLFIEIVGVAWVFRVSSSRLISDLMGFSLACLIVLVFTALPVVVLNYVFQRRGLSDSRHRAIDLSVSLDA